MFLFNISPICLKGGIVLEQSELLLKGFEEYKEKFKFISYKKIINFKRKVLLFFKISYFNIEKFKKSSDYEFLKDKIKIINTFNLDEKDKNNIEANKNNNEIIIESNIKNNEIPKCYYCGKLSGKTEYIIYEIFQRKCIQFGNINELIIKGINFLNDNIEKSFFNLPKKAVSRVISVGEGIGKETQKNYINLKNNLYPYILAKGQEDLSIYRVDSINSYKKLGNNSFGPLTLFSILSLSCGYEDPDSFSSDISKGNNTLIDLSVGDIYGGSYDNMALSSELIGSSFGKFKNIEDVNKIDKKDISKSLAILYGATYSHVTSMVSNKENIYKVIISGNPFDSLELFQIIQTSIGRYSNNSKETLFNDYLEYFEIIGIYADFDSNL